MCVLAFLKKQSNMTKTTLKEVPNINFNLFATIYEIKLGFVL